MTAIRKRGGLAALAATALFVLSTGVSGAVTPELEPVLSSFYGSEAARECRPYYSSLDIPAEEATMVVEAVRILAAAGFPYSCPRDYLRLVADLSQAGIGLKDLTMKIQEAVAKKVDPIRLIRVLEQRTDALKNARVVVLEVEGSGVEFLDRQMAYRVMADYLLRGVPAAELKTGMMERDLADYPALDNVIR